MSGKVCNTLFLCTGNSARSLIAEALLSHLGGERFKAYSADSRPTGQPDPTAMAVLDEHGLPTASLRSKNWDEFERPGAPEMDVVITVCDSAAAEACPVWPGAPVRAHWGLPDPAAVAGDEAARRAAFEETFAVLERRIRQMAALPVESLAPADLAAKLAACGEEPDRRRQVRLTQAG